MRRRLIFPLLVFSLVCAAQAQKGSAGFYSERERPARLPIEGATIFQHNCAQCHGTDGRGNGPASPALKHAAPDLTLIAQRNGGKFPSQRVREIIEGKRLPFFRGDREMPVWGPIFHEVDADQDWGEVRLDAVTTQVESMQRK